MSEDERDTASGVDVTITERRADITLRRPHVLNAMDEGVFEGLARAAEEVASAENVRVVVVSGEGRSFSSGIDTTSFGRISGTPEQGIARAQEGFRKIAALPMPVVASVRGHALGAGLQLALACDIRIVARSASLGLLELRYGIVPDLGGTQRLARLVGAGRAKKMIWLAERIDGAEAGRVGLAEIVVDDEDLAAATDDLAERLAAAPPLAVRAVKGLVESSYTLEHEVGMDREAIAQAEMLTSEDFAEAISAFVEKREPEYKAR